MPNPLPGALRSRKWAFGRSETLNFAGSKQGSGKDSPASRRGDENCDALIGGHGQRWRRDRVSATSPAPCHAILTYGIGIVIGATVQIPSKEGDSSGDGVWGGKSEGRELIPPRTVRSMVPKAGKRFRNLGINAGDFPGYRGWLVVLFRGKCFYEEAVEVPGWVASGLASCLRHRAGKDECSDGYG